MTDMYLQGYTSRDRNASQEAVTCSESAVGLSHMWLNQYMKLTTAGLPDMFQLR